MPEKEEPEVIITGGLTSGDIGSVSDLFGGGGLAAFQRSRTGKPISSGVSRERGGVSPEASGLDVVVSGAAPDATTSKPDTSGEIPVVTVVSTIPTIQQDDPEGLYHIEDSRGTDIRPTGKSFPSSGQLPVRPTAPSQSFMGPSSVPLPEVVVEAKRPPTLPPTASRPQLSPVGFGGLNPYVLGLGFLLKQSSANIGEDARVRALIERDLASRLLPVKTSVDRLTEPLPVVTVRSTRISDRPTTRTPYFVSRSPLGGASLRSFVAPYIAQPTSVLRPTPQTARKPRVKVDFDVNFHLIPTLEAPLAPARRPRTSGQPEQTFYTPSQPIVPPIVAPITPIVGVVPGVGFTPTPTPIVQPLPQFQGQCQCPQTQTKTKTRRRRRIRKKCYRGTYIERSDRVNKQQLEEVPCDVDLRTKSGTKLRKPRSKSRSTTGKPGKYTPGFPGGKLPTTRRR